MSDNKKVAGSVGKKFPISMIVLLTFILLIALHFAFAATNFYVPITLTNSQGTSTGSNFTQMIQFNASSYSANENANLSNIRFYQGSTELYSWCESNCSSSGPGNTTFWVNLQNGISANSAITIEMEFLPTSTNYDGIYAGQSAQISSTYAQYDNGKNVFGFYDNFNGTTLDPSWNAWGAQGTNTVANGLNLSVAANWHGYSNNKLGGYSGTTAILEALMSYNATSGGLAIGMFNGVMATGGVGIAIPGGSLYAESSGSPGASLGLIPNGFPISTLNLISMLNNGSSQLYQKNYKNLLTGSGNSLTTNSNISLSVFDFAGSTANYQYVRARSYPPNAVMPSVSFGTLTGSPTISLVSPTLNSGSFTNNNSLTINATSSSSILSNITTFLYNSTQLINQSNSTLSSFSSTFYSLPDGIYFFNSTATDYFLNTNSTSTYNITVDTVQPTIQFVSPTDTNNSFLSRSNIIANVTAADNNALANITLNLYNSTNLVNSTTSATSPYYLNITGLSDGIYYLNATATDSALNQNSTGTRKIVLDTTKPVITYGAASELNNTYVNRSWIFANVSVTEINEANITFNLYNSTNLVNSSFFTNAQRSINWTVPRDGIYYFNVTDIDNASNVGNSATSMVTIDTISPNISLIGATPSNNTYYNISSVVVNVSSSDNNGNHYSFVDFDRSLAGWWRLQQGNGTTFVDSSSYGNSATCSGATCPTYNTSGAFGGDYNFNGANYISSGNVLKFERTNPFSVCLWMYPTQTSVGDTLMGNLGGTTTGWELAQQSLTGAAGSGINLFLINTWPSNAIQLSANGVIPVANQWYHVCVTYNGNSAASGINVYINGTSVNNTFQTAFNSLGGSIVNGNNVNIGARSNNLYYQGQMDDILVFNRSLSTSEILSIYNATANQYYNNFTNLSQGSHTFTAYSVDRAGNLNSTVQRTITVDVTNPNVTLNTPANDTYQNTAGNVNLTANITDNIGLSNATLYVYNSTGLYNSTFINIIGAPITFAAGVVVNLVQGIYNWFYKVFDLAGNSFTTQNGTITVDTTNPGITLISPSNGIYSNISMQNYTTNLSDNIGLKNATLSIYNSSGLVSSTNVSFPEGTTSVNEGINISLSDGIYNWSYNTYDYAGNSNSTSNYTITIDTHAPLILNVSYTPNSAYYLKPNTRLAFTANISDALTGINSTFLVYNNGTFVNSTPMYLISGNTANGLFGANVTLSPLQENYTFYVWTNDSTGNVNMTSNSTIVSAWECSWTITPTNLGVTGGFSEEKVMGNVTISNTGDKNYSINGCNVTFARTASGSAWQQFANFSADYLFSDFSGTNGYQGLRYYDYTDNIINGSITVHPGENKTLIVNATFPSNSSVLTEYPYFPIFANINDSIQNLSNVLIAGTMVITSGAYLYDQIDAPSTNQIIYLTPKNISLSAYVRNLVDGTSNPNNTAYNVGFNWSIPNSVLTRLLDSSNLSVNYSILNNTAKQYLPLGNLTLQLNPTNLGTFLASDIGNFTISVTASGYRNSTGNLTPILESGNNTVVTNSINLIFQCYQPKDNVTVSACGSLDGDYVAPSSGGSTATGGGGGSSGGQGSIVSKADYTIVRGIQNELTVPFTNKDQNVSLKNLKFEVSGNIAKYIAIIPENLSELSPGQTVNIKLQITSPGYLPLGLQQITLRISGKIGASDYNENRQINIQINSMSTADAKSLLDEMQSLLAQMQKINLTTINLDPLLNESYVYFNNFQYDNLSADHDSLKAQATAGINAFNTINQLQTLISDAQVKGIDVSDAARLLQLAQLSLERGDYTEAQARSVDARNAYALETAGKFESIGYFLNANKGTIGLSAFVLAIITFTSYKLARLASLKNKLRKLKEEELILTQLIKLAQVQTFKEKRMEMEEYRESMLQYENKMAQVIEDIIDTETEIAHVLKFTSLENKLKSEKVRIIDLIKQLQTDYLKKGIIEAKAYELKLESYNKRLGEIEEKLAEIEAKQALKQARKEIALAK